MSEIFEDIFVVGTDTGVGKTVASLLLMQFFYAKGLDPFYLKPFQTGCRDAYDADSDAAFVYQNVKPLKGRDPAGSVVYCFSSPKAPHFASIDDETAIDLQVVQEAYKRKCNDYHPIVLEAAGGLLVPVNENKLIIDVVEMIGASPLLVARAGLGTINHTLLSLETLYRRGLRATGIVLMDTEEEETATEMIRENVEAIEKFSDVMVSGVIGRINDFSNPGDTCYRPFERMFTI